jgi:hypothetical protein
LRSDNKNMVENCVRIGLEHCKSIEPHTPPGSFKKKPLNGVVTEQCFWVLQGIPIDERSDLAAKGRTLNKGKLVDIPIPLPLVKQRRIVAKVEALMERVREAKQLRKGSREDADTLFHSALDHVLADVYVNSPTILPLGDLATASMDAPAAYGTALSECSRQRMSIHLISSRRTLHI